MTTTHIKSVEPPQIVELVPMRVPLKTSLASATSALVGAALLNRYLVRRQSVKIRLPGISWRWWDRLHYVERGAGDAVAGSFMATEA